jgi:HEAT repeat protein
MMVTVTRFDEVTALDVAEQRRLLRTGAPEQQVWAAWALGLELGERAVPELCIALDRDEHAGVRRHLLVILAGLGERAILDEMSTGEVDEAVRATAAQYALQTGEPTRLRPAIAAMLRDPSARVRRALLVAKQEGGAVLDTDDLATLVADPDAEVRELAIEALARAVEPERLFPGVLEDRIAVEPESYLRGLLMRLAVAGGRARRLLALGLTAPPSLTLELLHALVDGGQLFDWGDLAPLALRDIPAADYDLAFLLDDHGALGALSWLLARLVRALRSPYPPGRSGLERANFGARCYALLEPALRNADPSRLTAVDREAMAAIMADLEAFKAQMHAVASRMTSDQALDWTRLPHIRVRLRVLDALRELGVRPGGPERPDPGTALVPR